MGKQQDTMEETNQNDKAQMPRIEEKTCMTLASLSLLFCKYKKKMCLKSIEKLLRLLQGSKKKGFNEIDFLEIQLKQQIENPNRFKSNMTVVASFNDEETRHLKILLFIHFSAIKKMIVILTRCYANENILKCGLISLVQPGV